MHEHHTKIWLGVPTELLHRDHRKIRELMREYDALPPENRDRREWFFREIHRLLMLHFALEEEVVYPAIQRAGTRRAMASVDAARWNHRLVRYLLNEMDLLDPRDPTFDSKMGILRVNLEQYAATEEQTLFAEVRSMSREMQEALRTQVEQHQEQLLERERRP
jgi:hemerythrin superfamily protein